MKFYKEEAETIIKYFESNPNNGLNNAQVLERQKIYGLNVYNKINKTNPITILLNCSYKVTIPSIKIAIVIMLLLNASHSLYALCVITILYAIFDSAIKFKKQFMDAKNRAKIKDYCYVLRSSQEKTIDAIDLVPGDIIILKPGLPIKAEARIISCDDLEVDESILNGEQITITKTANKITHDARKPDQTNMIFCGTIVTNGYGKAIVIKTI